MDRIALGRSMGSAVVGAIVLAQPLLAGCAATNEDPPPSAETVLIPSSDPTTEAIGPAEGTGGEPLHAPTPPSASDEQQDPVGTTEEFLLTWSRPDLGYEEWWAGIEPFLNPSAREAYSGTDPEVVPRLRITGTSELEESTVDTSALVWVPTNEGRFGVRLSRTSGDAAWLVSRIYFPGDEP